MARMAWAAPLGPRQRRPGHKPCLPRIKRRATAWGPTEDTSGGFTLGGWTVPYFDEALGNIMGAQMGQPFDLLLGRKTFEIFATYWPHQGDDNEINRATKYVVSTTLTSHPWQTSVFLNGDVAAQVAALNQAEGPDLQVHGSGTLIQTLLKHDLVDEFWLKIFPVTLGQGKRLFGDGTLPAAYALVESQSLPTGVIVASFKRAGDVQTGSFGT
jgi:dihydrofolate reductase